MEWQATARRRFEGRFGSWDTALAVGSTSEADSRSHEVTKPLVAAPIPFFADPASLAHRVRVRRLAVARCGPRDGRCLFCRDAGVGVRVASPAPLAAAVCAHSALEPSPVQKKFDDLTGTRPRGGVETVRSSVSSSAWLSRHPSASWVRTGGAPSKTRESGGLEAGPCDQTRRLPRMNTTRAMMARMMRIVYNMPKDYPRPQRFKHLAEHLRRIVWH